MSEQQSKEVSSGYLEWRNRMFRQIAVTALLRNQKDFDFDQAIGMPEDLSAFELDRGTEFSTAWNEYIQEGIVHKAVVLASEYEEGKGSAEGSSEAIMALQRQAVATATRYLEQQGAFLKPYQRYSLDAFILAARSFSWAAQPSLVYALSDEADNLSRIHKEFSRRQAVLATLTKFPKQTAVAADAVVAEEDKPNPYSFFR